MGVSSWLMAKFILSGCKPVEGLDTNGKGVGHHQCAAAMPFTPCSFSATAVRSTVNIISNVDAALTSGVTEKRTIE